MVLGLRFLNNKLNLSVLARLLTSFKRLTGLGGG